MRGFYAGQDYLDSQINWAVSGGQAGSSLKPFALSAGIRQGFELKDTFEGNSPIEIGDTEFENQGDQDYGSAVNLITATANSINTAFIDLTDSMENGPEAIVKQANLMGVPPAPDKVKDPSYGFPNNTPGLEPECRGGTGQRHGQPDQHGQRLRDHRQRRARGRSPSSSSRSPMRTASRSTRTRSPTRWP